MNSKNPKVTVLMPVYNGEKYLRESIESILNQTFRDFEFLIINDGSTDKSREIITSFHDPRIRLIDNPANIGLIKSLNFGLKLAKRELIARQDADDISYPTRLEQQVKFLGSHQKVVLLGTSAQVIDDNGNPLNTILRMPVGLLAIHWYLMFQNPFLHSSVTYRNDIVWENMGGYNELFLHCEDYELFSRVAQAYPVENLPDILLNYRMHQDSITSLTPPPAKLVEDIVRKNLNFFLQLSDIPDEWAHFIPFFQTRYQRTT